MAFLCIYCLRDSSTVTPSEAHAFPYGATDAFYGPGGGDRREGTRPLRFVDASSRRKVLPAIPD